jgi:prepilin-type N-terminal cleavage/methylation domain-containing protein
MNKKKGFSLIELLVVISIVGITFPVLTTITLVVGKQQLTVLKLQQLNNQADVTMSYVQKFLRGNIATIKDASGVELCATNTAPAPYPSDVRFYGKPLDTSTPPRYITLSSSPDGNLNIGGDVDGAVNNNSVIKIQNFNIECARRSEFIPAVLKVSFTAVDPIDPTITIPYSTFIQLLNL